MPHATPLLLTLAAGFGLAFVLGLVAARLRLPPVVGYLAAGVVVGPYSPGFIADPALAQQLAEIGVILLMFGVGVHFSVGELLAARRVAVPGALVQIAVATALGAFASRLWGWSWGSGIVFGLSLSVASTVVLIRSLEDRGLIDAVNGRLALGWLVVQDLATVLVLVLLPPLSETLGGSGALAGASAPGAGGGIVSALAITLGKVGAFVLLMVVVGRRAVPWLLERVARTGSRELFTLSVLAVALGIAVGASALFGVSFALGAFFAGMVVNASDLNREAAANALPLQDAFSVLFFVAVGMLFDPAILVERPLELLAVLLVVMVGTPLVAFAIVLALRRPAPTALTVAASLAQIGEFSFILGALGVSLELLPAEAQSLIVAGALISIGFNPLMFTGAARLIGWLNARPELLARLERPGSALYEPEPALGHSALTGHAIIVGYGRVGSTIGRALAGAAVPYVVIEQDMEIFERLRDDGIPVLYGNASRKGVLDAARPDRARLILVTTPDPFQARSVLELARHANPAIASVVRTHSLEEQAYLEKYGAGTAVLAEHELAQTMARQALTVCGPAAA
ncbi:MAG TPA: cation:proton antiporter [Gemmatimonadales bacterium]|nr:cation:proton antiporter [Gemmatimonadales bacterium]